MEGKKEANSENDRRNQIDRRIEESNLEGRKLREGCKQRGSAGK